MYHKVASLQRTKASLSFGQALVDEYNFEECECLVYIHDREQNIAQSSVQCTSRKCRRYYWPKGLSRSQTVSPQADNIGKKKEQADRERLEPDRTFQTNIKQELIRENISVDEKTGPASSTGASTGRFQACSDTGCRISNSRDDRSLERLLQFQTPEFFNP